MPLSPLNLLVLDASVQSPEAPHTICAEISTFLDKAVTEHEVEQAFQELEAAGLVEEYGRGPHEPPNDVWYFATAEGRKTVDREWNVTFPDPGNSD